MKKHIFRLLTLLLCLGLLLPLPVSAADLYFTSLNDNLLPLTEDTMPVWSSRLLYVPYTVFDQRSTGVNIELNSSYNKAESTVTIYSINRFLVFDLRAGNCKDQITGEFYSGKAILRGGKPYVPLGTVCSFFGLNYSCTPISQGYLVRIKSDAAVLSDARFIDAAGELINRRVREYNQSMNPTPTTPPTTPTIPAPSEPTTPTPTPAVEEELPAASVRTYLAFRYTADSQAEEVLRALEEQGYCALFLMTPQALESGGNLVRRLLGSGHSIGILAEGGSLEETRQLLERGERALERTACVRTTVACVPKDQRTALTQEGWVCWRESLALTPTAKTGATAFATSALRKLQGRTRPAYLTLPATADTGRVLSTLLRQLKNGSFVVSVPLETKL